MPTLQIRLLGRLALRWDSQSLLLPATRKAQSLLAYLVMNRALPQSRDRLADLFWGEQPEHKARRSLATALWLIRRCLPAEGFLRTDADTVRFEPQGELWLDVDEYKSYICTNDFLSLQRGVALYRGDFLDGFYDDWVINTRYWLQSLFLEGLTRLMAGYEARENYHGALSTAQRLLEYDPLREDAHRTLMRAYCQLGQRNAALQQYERCRTIVQEELGAEPTAETIDLYQRILDGRHPVASVTITAPLTTPVPPSTSPRMYGPLGVAAPVRLVAREDELAFLLESWHAAMERHSSLVLVEGEAGVGKTRLVQELANRLHLQGVRVLWGRCYEFEHHLPYQPIAEALRTCLSTMKQTELERFPAWALAEVSRLVPELVERQPELPLPEIIGLDEERAHLFDGVARFLVELSSHGAVLIILEDLHWASDSTLLLLRYLVRHVVGCPILMVGTLRAESVGQGQPLSMSLQGLSQEGLCKLLRLACLPAAAVQALVMEISGAGNAVVPLAKRLYAETEGNPFFLMETIQALFETDALHTEDGVWHGDFAQLSSGNLPLPTSIKEAVRARVVRLSEAAQEALQVAAVAGLEFDFDLLCAAWQHSTEETLQALDVLSRYRLIEECTDTLGRDYAFVHHKIQEVVYADLPARRRQHLHALVGQAMERIYAAQAEELAGELAFHFQHARLIAPELAAKAIGYLLQAGDQARLLGAYTEALAFYGRALPLLEEQQLVDQAARTLMKIGLTHHNALQFREARRAYEEGFVLWRKAQVWQPSHPLPVPPHALRAAWWDVVTLDPAFSAESASGGIIDQLFCGLVELTAEMEILPAIAKSWEVLEEGKRYLFRIRPDALWSDGQAVTAHDFEFAWKRVLNPRTRAPLASVLYDIKGARPYHEGVSSDPEQIGVHALNDTTLSVELDEPAGYFLQVLALPVAYAVPQSIVEQHGMTWVDRAHLVVNGPFQIEAWKRGEFMTLVRNPVYSGRSRGNAQRVQLCLIEKDAARALYEAQELDCLDLRGLTPAELDRLRQGNPEDYVSVPCPTTWYLAFNTQKAPFDDIRVRQALALAIDKERLVNAATGGIHTPASGGLVPPAMAGYSPGIALPCQPKRAQQLLAEAGYPNGDGFPGQELECTVYPRMGPIASEVERQWQETLHIHVSFERPDLPTFMQKVEQESSHIFLSGWMADYPDPDNFLRVCLHWQRTGWKNKAYVALVQQARRAQQETERLRLFGEAERILIAEAAIIPLTHERIHLLVKPWIKLPLSPFRWWFWKDAIIAAH
ncbi:MAG: ABC transporter substrate-binding protein [Anaerolineae bacterium]